MGRCGACGLGGALAALLAALDDFEGHLAEFRQAIEAGDMERCRALIAAARARRAGKADS